MKRLLMTLALSLSACAGSVEPSEDVDAAETDAAITDATPARVACINSSTCPSDLACLQGLCQTPCEAYEAGCR